MNEPIFGLIVSWIFINVPIFGSIARQYLHEQNSPLFDRNACKIFTNSPIFGRNAYKNLHEKPNVW